MLKRPTAVLSAGFLSGILVAAAGAGLAVNEYMGFEYETATSTVAENRSTEEQFIELHDNETLAVTNYDAQITSDESVPAGSVKIVFSYNSTMAEPVLTKNRYPEDNLAVISAWVRPTCDDFDLFMADKDIVLDGLRNHKLVSINYGDDSAVNILVNPADKERVVYWEDCNDYSSLAESAYNDGFDEGYNEGYEIGYSDGYDEACIDGGVKPENSMAAEENFVSPEENYLSTEEGIYEEDPLRNENFEQNEEGAL